MYDSQGRANLEFDNSLIAKQIERLNFIFGYACLLSEFSNSKSLDSPNFLLQLLGTCASHNQIMIDSDDSNRY